MAEDNIVFSYNAGSFIISPESAAKVSKFDELLETSWKAAQKMGYFNFNLEQMKSRVLPGEHLFITDLNSGRGSLRRKPQSMMSLSQPYDSQRFNFTKVDKREVMLELCNEERRNYGKERHVVLINVSPIQDCSVLLVPDINRHLPQVLTLPSLELAIEMTLLSSQRSLLVGWNSLCAAASVNHLHFHAYYLRHELRLQTEPTTQLAGPCHIITAWPVPCFVFQLEHGDVYSLARNIHKVAEYLHQSAIAHNICLTRGSPLGEGKHGPNKHTLRAFVWARRSIFGVKEVDAFNVAFSELMGHIPIMNEEQFQELTDHSAAAQLSDTALPLEQFQSVRIVVAKLFDNA